MRKSIKSLRSTVQLLVLLSCCCSIFCGSSDAPGKMLVRNMQKYGMIDSGRRSLNGMVPLVYFVRWKEPINSQSFAYDILDSQYTNGGMACDTNAFYYTLLGPDRDYLVVSVLSPQLMIDTLLSLAIDIGTERVASPPYLQFSLRDSLFVENSPGQFVDTLSTFESIIELKKLLPTGQLVQVKQFNAASACGFSTDYNVLLLEKSNSFKKLIADAPFSSVIVYNIKKDTLFEISDSSADVLQGFSRGEGMPIYFLRGADNTKNLWKLSESGEKIQLTFFTTPQYVPTYFLWRDSIELLVGEWSGDVSDMELQVLRE